MNESDEPPTKLDQEVTAEARERRVGAAYDEGKTLIREQDTKVSARKQAVQVRDELQGDPFSQRQVANAIVHYVFRNTELEDYHAEGVPIDDERMKSLMVSSCKRMCEVLMLMSESTNDFELLIRNSHMMGAHDWYADDVDTSELIVGLRKTQSFMAHHGGPMRLRRSEYETLCEKTHNHKYVCDRLWSVTVMGTRFCKRCDPARELRKERAALLARQTLAKGQGSELFTVLRSHTAKRALLTHGIATVEDLAKLTLAEVFIMRGVGAGSIKKMEKLLDARGLTWANTREQRSPAPG